MYNQFFFSNFVSLIDLSMKIYRYIFAGILCLTCLTIFCQGKLDPVTGTFVRGSVVMPAADEELHVSSTMLRAPFIPDYGELPGACPEVNIPALYISGHTLPRINADCPGRPVSIQPFFSVSGGQPTSYRVEAIAYNPPTPDQSQLSTIDQDDRWAIVQQLPFGFCFYENTYTQVAICANGILSFNASQVSGQNAGWRTELLPPIPSPDYDQRGGDTGYDDPGVVAGNGYNWLNAIYGVFEDVDPSRGGTISYGVIGQAPCRMMIVKWDRVPLYNKDRMARLYESFSIVLYEGSNVIDVYVGRRNRDAEWNSGNGIIGIQNSDGTKGIAAPGRNNGDVWSTVINGTNTPEAWRFIPETQSQAQYTMKWFRGMGTSGEYLGQGDEYTFMPRLNAGMRDTVTVELVIKSCNGDIYDLQDTAEIVWPDIDELVTRRDTVWICHGESYTYRDSTYRDEGVYYAHGPNDECDDPSVLVLKKYPQYNTSFTAHICQGTQYEWDNELYDTPGPHERHYTSHDGCDSLATLNLIIDPVYNIEINHAICENDVYLWDGIEYKEKGDYTHYYRSVSGCDSTVTTHLTVNQTFNINLNLTICDNKTYHWLGETFTTPGHYTRTLQTGNGCDSVVTLNIALNPTHHTIERDTINFNETLTWRGRELTNGGEYHDSYQNRFGCDSVITMQLHRYEDFTWQYKAEDICADQKSLVTEMQVESGIIDSLSIVFDEHSAAVGFRDTALATTGRLMTLTIPVPRNLRAGYYSLRAQFFHRKHMISEQTLTITALYPASVLEQKWDDFVGVLTNKYNGNYDFTAFQWYKDGEQLYGETGSYIYQPLHYGSAYQCLLTDSEGLTLMTCPLIATEKAQISLYPTLLSAGEMMTVITESPSRVTVYNAIGQQVCVADITSGNNSVTAPRHRGTYIVDVRSLDGNHRRRFNLLVR